MVVFYWLHGFVHVIFVLFKIIKGCCITRDQLQYLWMFFLFFRICRDILNNFLPVFMFKNSIYSGVGYIYCTHIHSHPHRQVIQNPSIFIAQHTWKICVVLFYQYLYNYWFLLHSWQSLIESVPSVVNHYPLLKNTLFLVNQTSSFNVN